MRRRRDRAARSGADHFLRARAAEELLDRLRDVNRSFARGLELGGGGAFARLRAASAEAGDKVAWLASADLSAAALARTPGPRVVADEERLTFMDAAFDVVLAPLSLHWTNDLPGALIQIRHVLKPDGLFLGALLGGATLTELRGCLLDAEAELTGGAAARVSPAADLADVAGLLQRAGFALPVADADVLTVRYADPFALLRDLRALGETAALAERSPALRREVLARAAALYAQRHADPDGRVRATFEMIFLTGWAPHESQPRPLKPGAAATRLADALGVTERSAGEKTGPGRR